MPATALALAGCLENLDGTDADDPQPPPDAITVVFSDSNVMVRPGNPATVELDLLAPNEFSGGIDYGIDFSEATSLIAIDTGPCSPDRPTCEEWTIRVKSSAEVRAESYSIPILTSPNFTESGTSPEAYLSVFALPQPEARPGAVALEAGPNHAHVQLSDGSVWTWGTAQDLEGVRMNSPAGTRERLPGRVVDLAASRVASFAVLDDGTVWYWQVQDGTLFNNDAAATGRAVTELPPAVIDIDAAGKELALAAAADGAVYEISIDRDDLTVRPVMGLPPVAAVAAAPDGLFDRLGHLALTADGAVWTWEVDAEMPAPTRVEGLPVVTRLAHGGDCVLALAEDGGVWQWSTDAPTPVQVVFDTPTPAAVDVAVSSRAFAAVLGDGSVWTWGEDDLGGRGRGPDDRLPDEQPAPIPGLDRVVDVDGGASSYFLARRETCADGGGNVVTWGELDGRLDAEGVGGFPLASINTRPVPLQSFGDTAACEDREVTVYRVGNGSGTVTGAGEAIDCGTRCAAFAPPGTTFTLTATADEGSEFVGWDWDCAGGAATTTVTLTRNQDCLARFAGPSSGLVAVSVLPATSAGRVTSTPVGIDCGTDCESVFGAGAMVELTPGAPADDPVAGALYAFAGWTGDGCAEGMIEVNGDVVCQATFERVADAFRLGVEIRGDGTVTSRDPGAGELVAIACTGPTTDCAGAYTAGTTVQLELQPAPGFEVVNAFGACRIPGEVPVAEALVSADDRCTVVFRALPEPDRAVARIFVDDPQPEVGQIVGFDGRGSYILNPQTGTEFPDRIDLWEWDFEDDGTIDVAGGPGVADTVASTYGSAGLYDVFLRVTGRSTQDGGTLSAATRLTISVGEPDMPGLGPFLLGVGPTGTNRGTIQVNPPGPLMINANTPPFTECVDQICSQFYDDGTVVTLTAVPANLGGPFDDRDAFVDWQGAGCPVAGSTSATEQLTIDDAINCFASFRSVRELRVLISGDGSVSTGPAGISNCTDDCSAIFDVDSRVVMTPTPGEGQRFAGWVGEADCEDGAVTLVADRVCTARFEPAGNDGTVTLTLDVDGGPLSSLRSLDGRLSCPGTCQATYAIGSEVTLVAENGPGEGVGGWTADCATFGQQSAVVLQLTRDTLCGVFFQQ